jgi:ABC-type sugar transport system ATPase subunit
VRPGEIFGLIGLNGAGKSTLVKMLTTMLAPTSGRARVAGFDVAAESRVRAPIGYVPQLLSADGALTGYENLLLSARLYLVPRGLLSQPADVPGRRAARADAQVFCERLWASPQLCCSRRLYRRLAPDCGATLPAAHLLSLDHHAASVGNYARHFERRGAGETRT